MALSIRSGVVASQLRHTTPPGAGAK